MVDLAGKEPMIWIPGRYQKSGKSRYTPMAPEFLRFLLETPERHRSGFVFNPVLTKISTRPTPATFKRKVADFGRMANIKVKDLESGGVKRASAHDLRRSFATRWAKRVMPAVLQDLMRHAKIETTMKFYAMADPIEASKAVREAFEGISGTGKSNSEVTPAHSDGYSTTDETTQHIDP